MTIGIPTVPRKHGTEYLTSTIGVPLQPLGSLQGFKTHKSIEPVIGVQSQVFGPMRTPGSATGFAELYTLLCDHGDTGMLVTAVPCTVPPLLSVRSAFFHPMWVAAAESLLDELPVDPTDPLYGRVRVVLMNNAPPGTHPAFSALQRRMTHPPRGTPPFFQPPHILRGISCNLRALSGSEGGYVGFLLARLTSPGPVKMPCVTQYARLHEHCIPHGTHVE